MPKPINGFDLAAASGARVIIGQPTDTCCYAWRRRVIVLTPRVATGTDAESLVIAAEEAAHHRQSRWAHWMRFLAPVRWWEESDAFLRVKRALRSLKQAGLLR